MDGLTDIDRLIQRATLDAHYVGSAVALVPKSRAALWEKCTVERVPGISGPRPDFRFPLCDVQCGQRHDKGNAKSRSGLFAALLAMAYIKLQGITRQLIADSAALTPTEKDFVFVWHGS